MGYSGMEIAVYIPVDPWVFTYVYERALNPDSDIGSTSMSEHFWGVFFKYERSITQLLTSYSTTGYRYMVIFLNNV